MTMLENKYKEKTPESTISKIQAILDEIGITNDIKEEKAAETVHSCHIRWFYKSFFIGITNGKGTTREFSLASGYAEFMERLQTHHIFNLDEKSHYNIPAEGFSLQPSEKYFLPDEIMRATGTLNSHIREAFGESRYRTILNHDSMDPFGHKNGGVLCLPFKNAVTNEIEYVPYSSNSLLRIDTSNGMCAGNTKIEALNQGISEIVERYAQKEILLNGRKAKTIPLSNISTESLCGKMISEIIGDGRFKLILKDCSLDEGFPVVAVIIMDTVSKKYFVRFGAFPVFEIALERCITEIFQGFNRETIKDAMLNRIGPFILDTKDKLYNAHSIAVNGTGIYPPEFLSEEDPVYATDHFLPFNSSNQEIYQFWLDLAGHNGWDIFYMNASWLGFPAYHIVIPQIMSRRNLELFSSEYLSDDQFFHGMHDAVREVVHEGVSINKFSIYAVFPLENNFSFDCYLPAMRAIASSNTNLSARTLAGMALHFLKSDYERCLEGLLSILPDINSSRVHKSIKSYYNALAVYLTYRAHGLSFGHIDDCLRTVNPESFQEVIKTLADHSYFALNYLFPVLMPEHHLQDAQDLKARLNSFKLKEYRKEAYSE